VNDPHINPPAPKPRRKAAPSKSGKVNAYVRAHFKHVRLAVQYQARIDALLPLKRRVMAADTDVKIRHHRMTGGELGAANRIINTTPLTPAEERKARAVLYPPKQEAAQ
jgi:hypothetical protein